MAEFAARLLSLYSFLIWIRILLSWVSPYPQPGSFTYYMARLVDPYLNLFRSSRARIGMLDFSPIIGIAVISVASSLLSTFARFGHLTFGIILANIIQAFWSYGVSIYLLIIIIMLIIRLIGSLMGNPMMASSPAFNISSPVQNLVRKSFGSHIPRDSTVCIITLLIDIALYVIFMRIFALLAWYAMQIPF